MNMNKNQGLNLNINPNELDDVVCDSCGNSTFIQAVLLKRIPASLSPNGKKTFLPMPIFECSECGNVNDELIPKVKGSDDEIIK
tara:strand:- start:16051 stop:16302 length:252 start_codon:yes stop_codon:yes gene_type:complete